MKLSRLVFAVFSFTGLASCYLNMELFNEYAPQAVFSLNSNNCQLPCFLGITPGETPYSEAIRYLENSIPDNQIIDDQTFWLLGEDGTHIYITVRRISPDRGDYVGSIELSTWGEGAILSLGDMMSAGYRPMSGFRNRVSGGPNGVNLLVVFDNEMQIAGTVHATHNIDNASPIDTLIIVAYQDRC